MSEYIDSIVRDVMSRRDEDLPTGAKALVMSVKAAETFLETRQRKTYYFPGDWKGDLPKSDKR